MGLFFYSLLRTSTTKEVEGLGIYNNGLLGASYGSGPQLNLLGSRLPEPWLFQTTNLLVHEGGLGEVDF